MSSRITRLAAWPASGRSEKSVRTAAAAWAHQLMTTSEMGGREGAGRIAPIVPRGTATRNDRAHRPPRIERAQWSPTLSQRTRNHEARLGRPDAGWTAQRDCGLVFFGHER